MPHIRANCSLFPSRSTSDMPHQVLPESLTTLPWFPWQCQFPTLTALQWDYKFIISYLGLALCLVRLLDSAVLIGLYSFII